MDFIRRMNPILLFSTLGLVGFGIVMVYSASFPVGTERMGDPYHFLKKQAFAATLENYLAQAESGMPVHRWEQPARVPFKFRVVPAEN